MIDDLLFEEALKKNYEHFYNLLKGKSESGDNYIKNNPEEFEALVLSLAIGKTAEDFDIEGDE